MDPTPLPERLEKAVAWYRENRATIAAALPLRYPGGTYHPAALPVLDQAIADYQAGKLSPTLATAYVLEPIRRIYGALKPVFMED